MNGNYGGHSSFSSAFSSAARDLGPGRSFSFNGNSYSTNRADGRDMRPSISSFSRPSPSISTFSGNYGGHSSFSSAFSSAAKDLGPGRTFNFNGKSYTTNRADGRDMRVGNSFLRVGKLYNHFNPMKNFQSSITAAAKKYAIPQHVIKGVISRESGAGTLLGKNGCKPGWGDNNNAYGLMQIDKRYHSIDAKKGVDNIDAGTKILSENLKKIEKKFPNWTKEQQLQGAVAAYNFGVKNVKTWENLDKGTAGNNYSEDVMRRAEHLK